MDLQTDSSRLRLKLYYGEEKPVSTCLRVKYLPASVALAVQEPSWQG